MLFNSYGFVLLFAPVVISVYLLTGGGHSLRLGC